MGWERKGKERSLFTKVASKARRVWRVCNMCTVLYRQVSPT